MDSEPRRIAHDLNNIAFVISGYAQRIEETLPKDRPAAGRRASRFCSEIPRLTADRRSDSRARRGRGWTCLGTMVDDSTPQARNPARRRRTGRARSAPACARAPRLSRGHRLHGRGRAGAVRCARAARSLDHRFDSSRRHRARHRRTAATTSAGGEGAADVRLRRASAARCRARGRRALPGQAIRDLDFSETVQHLLAA